MAVTLAVIGVIYLAAEGALLALFVVALRDGDVAAAAGAAMFAAGIPFLLVSHARRAGCLALRMARASVVEPGKERELQALVARVAAQADLPAPRLAVVQSPAENAFAVGTSPGQATVALTAGIVERLDEEELEAVVAHEISHIANRDTAVMTFVSGPALAGWGMRHSDDFRLRLTFRLYLPIHLLGLLLMWSISRYREYVADRGSALLTGAPEQLMSALQKLAGKEPECDLRGGAAISALCIVSARPQRRLELLMDHPPVEKRLRKLEKMARELGRPVR
jgi:heat shock protein HtpX